jgi:hypothetical protein
MRCDNMQHMNELGKLSLAPAFGFDHSVIKSMPVNMRQYITVFERSKRPLS